MEGNVKIKDGTIKYNSQEVPTIIEFIDHEANGRVAIIPASDEHPAYYGIFYIFGKVANPYNWISQELMKEMKKLPADPEKALKEYYDRNKI